MGRVFNAVALLQDLVPKLCKGAHLADFSDEPQARIDEERDARGYGAKIRSLVGRRLAHRVQHRKRGRQSIGQFLFRRRARLLQVVGTDIHRIEPGRRFEAPDDHVRDHAQGRPRRVDIGAARQVFLDQVILGRALNPGDIRALFFGQCRIERQHPGRCRIDGHGRVHLLDGNLVEQQSHVAQMADGHPNLAHLAARERMIGIIAGLGRQIEGDGQSRLALFQIGPVELVRGPGGGVTGIGAENPGRVFRGLWGFARHFLVAHQNILQRQSLPPEARRR